MKRVRETMGLTNLILMIPFCRRVPEAEKVLEEMAKNGLRRGENGLEVYVMCEIPNNVLMIDEFSQVFDGFSIGSNDLTQLTLGVDRDSSLVAHDFDERDPGVLRIVSPRPFRGPIATAAIAASAARRPAIIRSLRNSWSRKASTLCPSIPTR